MALLDYVSPSNPVILPSGWLTGLWLGDSTCFFIRLQKHRHVKMEGIVCTCYCVEMHRRVNACGAQSTNRGCLLQPLLLVPETWLSLSLELTDFTRLASQ